MKKIIPKPKMKGSVDDCIVRELLRCYRKGYNQALNDKEREEKKYA